MTETRVLLYIATSADGYIATADGGVAWLDRFNNDDGNDYGYHAMLSTAGHLIMGGKTYRQVLGFGDWPYGDLPTTVITRQPLTHPPAPNIRTYVGDVAALVTDIKTQTQKHIWLVGGAEIVALFQKANQIDDFMLSVMPVLLGDGVRLFPSIDSQQALTLKAHTVYQNGVVQLHYIRQENP